VWTEIEHRLISSSCPTRIWAGKFFTVKGRLTFPWHWQIAEVVNLPEWGLVHAQPEVKCQQLSDNTHM
jgi:hypothetical protein